MQHSPESPHALRDRRARVTVLVTVGGVLTFGLGVLWLTGVLSGEGAPRRAASTIPPGALRQWLRVEAALLEDALPLLPAAPFLVALDPDGQASIVNGREELRAELTPPGVQSSGIGAAALVLTLPGSKARLTLMPEEGGYSGSLALPACWGERAKAGCTENSPDYQLPVKARALAEGLPELRFLKAPDRDEARIRDIDLSHVWAAELREGERGAPEPARVVIFTTDSGELQASVSTARRDFGTLAGRQFGRLVLASSLSDDGLAALELELSADDMLSGTLVLAGQRRLSLVARRADRVELEERACGDPPPRSDAPWTLRINPLSRQGLDALRWARTAERRFSPPRLLLALPHGVPASMREEALGRVQALWPGLSLESVSHGADGPDVCVWIYDRAGRLTHGSAGFPSAFAGGRDFELRLADALAAVTP